MKKPDPLIGLQFDEYLIESQLGAGGMARIYKAKDIRLERTVAIKVIDSPLRQSPEYIRRFEREARAIARLEHPHIVRLYRFGEAHERLYMAMQYVSGAALDFILNTYRQDKKYMAFDNVNRLIREICLALDYAHSQGVIHRDVKPSNVLLNSQGTALLTDFGLALIADSGTRGEILGSPAYVAPEQALSSAKAVSQSDLYSVGIMIYEMLTNQVPFSADDPLDVAMKHLAEDPPSPRKLRKELNPSTEAVVLRMLDKDPKRRYPTGQELTAALADALK